MFLVAVARSERDYLRNIDWNGKIGIRPFVRKGPSQRASCNRPPGTLATMPLNVAKKIDIDYSFEKVLPSVKERWPNPKQIPIYIQQENMRPHVDAFRQYGLDCWTQLLHEHHSHLKTSDLSGLERTRPGFSTSSCRYNIIFYSWQLHHVA